jgi:cytosine/adenosine deaminase-related metal-dependent hydrolase
MKTNEDSVFAIGGGVVSDGEEVFLSDGAVLIDSGLIVDILPSSEARARCSRFVDVGGRLILPGFVNFHHHLYSYFAVGLQPCGKTDTFSEVLQNFWWRLDSVLSEECVFYSSVLGLMESLRHGTTTVFDHHASMGYVSGSLDKVAEAFDLTGARGALCFETSDRFGEKEVARHIEENLSFCLSHRRTSMLRGLFGLHASLTLSEKTLRAVADRRPPEIPVHIHCAEAMDDVDACRRLGYAGPVERLYEHGLLDNRSLLAHVVHLSTRDGDLIRTVRPLVVTNPESNANNGVGRMDRDAVADYVLGTDGMSGDMIQSLRTYVLLGLGGKEPSLRTSRMFFQRSREALRSFFPQCRGLAKGSAADITAPDYIPLTPVSRENVLAHLLFGAKQGRAFMTIVNGRVLWKDGVFPHLDTDELRRQGKRAARELHAAYSRFLH